MPLALNWAMVPMTGWGTFGENLVKQLLKSQKLYPVIAHEQSFWQEISVLKALKDEQAELPGWFQQNSRYPDVKTKFPILHATSGSTFKRGNAANSVWGSKNVAITFFESVVLEPEAIKAARTYDLILTGSECELILTVN